MKKILMIVIMMLMTSSCGSNVESLEQTFPSAYEIIGVTYVGDNKLYKLRDIQTGCLILFGESMGSYPITSTTIKCPE